MNFNMELPGLKGVNIEGIVEQENRMLVYISMRIFWKAAFPLPPG